MTDACGPALSLLDAMVAEVRKPPDVERGFVVCRLPDGEIRKGTTCGGDHDPLASTHRCLAPTPYCPDGGTPVASFHTHPTRLRGRLPPTGEAAKALLIPSVKDFAADREIDVDVGCVGGRLNDGRGFLWCFPKDAQVEVNVRGVWNAMAQEETKLLEALSTFYGAAGNPCLEAYFPVDGATGEDCAACGEAS